MLQSMMIVQEDLPQLESEFSSHQQSVDEKEATFEAQLDGGDTESLIAEIQATTKAEAARLQSRLLDLAPWVSAEALTALLDRPGLLPEAALTDILKANPDALSSHALVEKAREQLPTEKVDEALSHAREQITERTRLEMELAGHIAEISLAANRALNYHLKETPINLAAVRTWLDRKNSLAAAYGEFDAWIHDGKADRAMAALQAIPGEFELLEHQKEAFKDFEQLAKLKAQVQPGVYLYRWVSEGQVMMTERLVITR